MREELRAAAAARPRRRVARRRGDAGPGPLAHLHRRAVAQGRAARSSTRPASCGVSRRRPSRSACGSTRTPRPPTLKRDGIGVMVTTPLGAIRAGKVALGTNAFKPVLKRLGSYIAPVYDYCMVTEPLTAEQMASIGWAQPPGPVATSPTSSTTTDSPRTTGSCGAATTPSTTGAARCRPSSRAGPRRGPSSASTSSRRSRSSRTSSSPTCGAARSTRRSRFTRVLGSGDERPRRLRARLHRASASPPRGSAPR